MFVTSKLTYFDEFITCPISWAIPQPEYSPEIYLPFSSDCIGVVLNKSGTESYSIPICCVAAYINAPANILL